MIAKYYYLKADHQEDWDEVTYEQYRSAERNAGFYIKHPSGDPEQTATEGFMSGGISGKVEYISLEEHFDNPDVGAVL